MLERVIEAIERRDFQRANRLLQELKQQDADNPWLPFYLARLEEVSGNLAVAEQGYREILRHATHAKIMAQARQGIERLAQIEQQEREYARDRALAEPGSQELGVLILQPIETALKQNAAQKFAKIMNLDPYIARLHLPTRAWRLYRTGTMGELRFYTSALNEAEIPGFCLPINQINQIKVYKVRYFDSKVPQATVVCQRRKEQLETISFDWSQVSQRIDALLPIFEQCLDRDPLGKLIRKTQIQDYAKLCDLHLPKSNAIIRLCDRVYQFQQGVSFSERQKSTDGQITISENWNHLMQFVQQQLPKIPIWSDFNMFALPAMDFPDTLKLIEPHIDLLRREESGWDNAFQLYSGLIFSLKVT